MNAPVIAAASCITATGYGNDQSGWQDWPPEIQQALRTGDGGALKWSLLFDSEADRFSRMDGMCRLGFMTAELLRAGIAGWESERRDRVGVCLETEMGSLDTDMRFLQTASPSAFTYTLPSTFIGEVCIRYRLRGPVLCMVSPRQEASPALAAAAAWLDEGQAGAVLYIRCDVLGTEIAHRLASSDGRMGASLFGCAILLAQRSGNPREKPLDLPLPRWRLNALIPGMPAGSDWISFDEPEKQGTV